MKMPKIKEIELQVNYIYLTDKLMGIKVFEKEKLQIVNSIVYKIAWIGKSEHGDLSSLNSSSHFATNRIVRNGNVPIYAFANESTHSETYMTDLFVPTRNRSNIYNKNCAFFSSIIYVKDKVRIDGLFNRLHRIIKYDLPF